MELRDLVKYAENKYNITEQYPWPEYPGLSVLVDPDTHIRLALLMRQSDFHYANRERCDIRCGDQAAVINRYPWLTIPYRMNGNKWIGVRMDERTDEQVVYKLFDMAVNYARNRFTIVIDQSNALKKKLYHDTPLNNSVSPPSTKDTTPRRIMEMMSMYKYMGNHFQEKRVNFYRQGKYMENYTDTGYKDIPYNGFFPTYHDLNIPQLRAYFAWRTMVRKGIYEPISSSLVYMYIFELLNGIGVHSPKETIDTIQDVARKCESNGIGAKNMISLINDWLLDYAVIHQMDKQVTLSFLDQSTYQRDESIGILKEPDVHTDQEVYDALCCLAGKNLEKSPIMKKNGIHLVADVYRFALKADDTLFYSLFGEQKELNYHPLANAIYYQKEPMKDVIYPLDSTRVYSCQDGKWSVQAYLRLNIDVKCLENMLRETDRQLRLYLHAGRSLKQVKEEPIIDKAVQTVLHAEEEAKKPHITIHLDTLSTIRKDAAVTRDSLLTEEEMEEEEPVVSQKQESQEEILHTIVSLLLEGKDAEKYIQEHHLMPSVISDEINEMYYDDIGDSVVEYDGRHIQIVEDYREDLKDLWEESHE